MNAILSNPAPASSSIRIHPKESTKESNGTTSKRAAEKPYMDDGLMQECYDFIKYYKFMKAGNFECQVCDKRLSSRQSLITHYVKLHSKHRLPKVLRIQSNSIHKKIIAKFKDTSCFICSKEYASRQTVKAHFASQHGIEILRCHRCPEVFIFENGLENHFKNNPACDSQVQTFFKDNRISFFN